MKRRQFLKFPITALAILLMLYVTFTLVAMLDVPTWNWTAVRGSSQFFRGVLLVGGCVIAGALRISLLHPHYAQKYAGWLMSTPWHPGLQLPLGPVDLVWEDLLLVVPLGALAQVDAGISLWLPVTAYLLGYSWAGVLALREGRSHWFSLGLAFLWSIPLLRLASPWILLPTLIAIDLLTRGGLSISLRHFPWDLGDPMRETHRRPRSSLAWPLDRVGPVAVPQPIPLALGLATAAMIAWWVFVVVNLLAGVFDGILVQTLATEIPPVCALICVGRLLQYCLGYSPPISVMGRVMTGRLLIPGYDHVFIAPAVCCLLAWLLPRVFANHLPLQVSSAFTVLCMAGVAINMGPTVQSWRLTGHHRLFPMTRREPVVPKGRNTR